MAFAFDLSTTTGRLTAYADFLWNDHAYVRLALTNAHWITDELARASQPWPFQIKAWRERGVRTIVNLRAGDDDSYHVLEAEACARHDIRLVAYPVTSRHLPTRDQVLGARRLFDEIEYPAMMHCKSGADRASLMSALYLHMRKGVPVAEAARQLALRFGHLRSGATGILDYFFEYYVSRIEPRGISLEDWVRSDAYDRKALERGFKPAPWSSFLTDRILRRE
jgi:protein tyrosine/serine phosphatase